MKHIKLLLLFVIIFTFGKSQTINPLEGFEQCPTPNFPNGAGYIYIISFSDTASEFTIGTETNCKVQFYTTPYNNDVTKASISLQFKDQSAVSTSLKLKKERQ